MEITIHNYETVLIDYFDGKLNALETAEVILFLEQHPEIKKEFEGLDKIPVNDNIAIDSTFREGLKKLHQQASFHGKSFDEIMIAQLEGDCSAAESAIINEITDKNSSLKKLRDTFLLTKLKPNQDIVFPNKPALKRKPTPIFYLNFKWASAAALILIFALMFLMYNYGGKYSKTTDVAIRNNENKVEKNSTDTTLPTNSEITNDSPSTLADVTEVTQKNNLVHVSHKKQQTVSNPIQVVKQVENKKDSSNILIAINRIPIKTINAYTNFIAAQLSITNSSSNNEKTIAANVKNEDEEYPNLSHWMKKKFIDQGKKHLVENEKPEPSNVVIDPLTVASVGASILEKTTGKKVFLTRSYHKDGSVKSYTFAAGKFKYERVKK
jgi:hypothetical protein